MRSFWSLAVALFICLGILSSTTVAKKPWWETASFYQIYPRSFKDSDGDGIGDLNGVTSSLEYLKEIGIAGTWLSPFLQSPMADFGYDISNFTAVDPLFGTMEDFEAMVKRAQELGVRIILDFVPNHTSDESEWFIKSAARDKEYKDYYVWHPGKMVDGKRQSPNNWVSIFRGSAWTWNEEREEYYLHQFHRKQPDLNYRNPKVKNAMEEVLRFWLRKGVHGFRIDAVNHCYEIAPDADGNFPDEPRNDWNNDPEDYGYVEHIYTSDQYETPLLVYDWRSVLDKHWQENGGEERILMVEAWSPLDIVFQYYGNETAEGAQIPFNFQMISHLQPDSDAYHYAELINSWLSRLPPGKTANWVIGSHDKNRVGSRYGTERIDMFNILLKTLPGCSITYYGEEIGMTDVWISWNDTVDPQACNSFEDGYESRSRDPARTPFHWNSNDNAGFSEGSKPWLPIGDDYNSVNLKRERGISMSHLNVYKQLQALRKEKTFEDGDVSINPINRNILAIRRSLYEDNTYIVLLNIFDSVENFSLFGSFDDLPRNLEFVMGNGKTYRRKGDKVITSNITLMPYESIILKTPAKVTK